MPIYVYTDGACSGNPGKGGYCAIILNENGEEKVVSGYSEDTTNNRMELTAVISGLKQLKEKCSVTVVSDSKYVCDAIIKGWLASWKSKGWRKADNKPVLNIDLWKALDELLSVHNVTFKWVKGHSDNEYNERCDRIATKEYIDRTETADSSKLRKTNFDILKEKDVWQMAEFLFRQVKYKCWFCNKKCKLTTPEYSDTHNCIEGIKEWLESEDV